MHQDADVDVDKSLGRVCDESRLPAHVRQPVASLEKQLAGYSQTKEAMRSSVPPALLAANDQAYSKAISRVLVGFGLDRKTAWQHEPAPAPAPAPTSGVITFTFNPLRWLRRQFRRGK